MQLKAKNSRQYSWFPMASLIFVILMWGSTPVVHKRMYEFFSPTVYSTLMALIAGIALFVFSYKKLHLLNKKLLAIAIPTGVINAIAALTQKIGLQYTTPSTSSFLDTLSCVAVPLTLLIVTRKIPSVWKALASILCLSGCFIFTGVSFTDLGSFGAGEILCATAGVLYGVNTAITGIFAKDVYVPLHVTVHMGVQVVTGSIIAAALNFITVGGEPIEKFRISFEPIPVLILLFMGLVATAVGWMIRINVLKKIDPTVVGIMMPMSSVVTCFISVISGSDTLSARLVIGGLLCVSASLVSNIKTRKERAALSQSSSAALQSCEEQSNEAPNAEGDTPSAQADTTEADTTENTTT